jgi:hypothetical protein
MIWNASEVMAWSNFRPAQTICQVRLRTRKTRSPRAQVSLRCKWRSGQIQIRKRNRVVFPLGLKLLVSQDTLGQWSCRCNSRPPQVQCGFGI